MDDLEFFVSNFRGKVQRKTLNNREYLVAPVSMLVPGIHAGTKGPLFYSPEVIANSVRAWNGMPLTLRHPLVPGSARTTDVIAAQGIGNVFNVTLDGQKLVGEAWIDIENAKILDPSLIDDVENGTSIEVSTGLYSGRTEEAGTFNGASYTSSVNEINPDHLAVLRNEKGACSLDDGCGINNEEGEPMTNRNLFEKFTEFVGNFSKPKPKEEESTMALNAERKKAAVDSLIANCDCYKESDRETLNALDDNELVEKVLEQNTAQAETITENAKFVFPKKGEKMPAGGPKKADGEEDDDEDDEEIEAKNPAKNTSGKKLSEKEWLASAPESIQNAFAHSQSLIENERQSIIESIANGQEDPENARAELEGRTLNELKTIARFASVKVQETPAVPSYEGRGSFVANRGGGIEFDRNDTIPQVDFFATEE